MRLKGRSATIYDQMAEHLPIERSTVEQAIYVAVSILEQAIGFLDLLGTDERYIYPSQAMPGGTIGKHIRHAVDHYNLLLKASIAPVVLCLVLTSFSLRKQAVTEGKEDFLSYDVRSRNTPIETSISEARETLSDLVNRLKVIVPTIPLDKPVTLHAVTPFPAVMGTSFGREVSHPAGLFFRYSLVPSCFSSGS